MKRLVAGFVLVLIALFGAGLALVGFWLSPQSKLAKSDAIVAISGGDTVARASEAIKLYQAGWAPVLIFSGAALDTTGPSNAAAMKRQAVAAGVPERDIILDEAAANTEQNAEAVTTITASHHYHSIILVTSPYHQRRASVAFHKALGSSVRILNHSTVDQRWRRSAWWATSYSRSLTWAELRKAIYESLRPEH